MGKKNLSEKKCYIYPKNLDMSKSWFVQFWTNEEKPRRLKYAVTNLKSRAARIAEADRIISEITAQNFIPARINAPNAANSYIKKLQDALKSRKDSLTYKSYSTMKSHLKIFDTYCIENKIQKVDLAAAENFLDDLTQKGLHPKTINNYRITFNALGNRLVKRKEMRKNVFAETENKKGESDCPEWFKPHEASKLRKYMLENAPFLWAAARWEYYCLMRPGTIGDLQVQDVDFYRWRVKIRAVDIRNKTDKSYWVVIPQGLRQEIEPLCLYQFPPNYYLVGHDGAPSSDKVKTTNYWHRHFQKVLKTCGFNVGDRRRTFYGWKHTGFAHAYLNGVGLVELMKQAGHSDIAETYNYIRKLGLDDFPDIQGKFPILK